MRARLRALERTLAQLATSDSPEAVLRQRAQTILGQIEGLAAAILIANTQARYVDANPAAERLTGYTRAEILQLSVWDLTPERRLSVGARLWRDFLQRGRMRGTYQLRQKDGTIVAAQYFAVAHVLPNLHVSALTTPGLIAALEPRSRAR